MRLPPLLLVVCTVHQVAAAADLNPQGKPEQDLVKVTNARYFVWLDSEGWHLRTASKGLAKFTGSITLAGGTFGKLRTVGLESKGRAIDRWEVSAQRDKITFEIQTGGSFDGFDFEVRGQGATIEYDLKIGQNAQAIPRRIFIGRDNGHPQAAKFALPAAPDKGTE